MKYLGIFFLAFAVDYVWAVYIKSAASGKPYMAAISSAVIFLSGGMITLSYIDDGWMLLPATAGAALGTYFAIGHTGD